MRIIRFVSTEGDIHFGMPDPGDSDYARIIEGNIFDRYDVTGKRIRIGKLLPPVEAPNILALGLNYRSHADETNISYPDIPIVFLKSTNSLIGIGSPILLPKAGPDQVDYEAELAVVIGRQVKNIAPDKAMDAILGYTCGNDISARDWQFHKQKQQWARGKSFDTFCPLGPCLVTREDIPDPGNLRIMTILNGEVLQDSNTANMIFDVPAIVSHLSRSMTLNPGTVILTGTPEGVGFTRQPPVFLKDGDTITIRIEKIGELINPVKREL
jgi:2-keto-4-pentenoate hydratase/2-oxohepta-3-ene-1,7-dioic acid hydratase in catechol pathway